MISVENKSSGGGMEQRSLSFLVVIIAFCFWGGATANVAFAGGSSSFRVQGMGDLLEGEFDNIALTPEGILYPAPANDLLAEGISVYVWGLAGDGHGGVIAATGSEGHLYHIQKDGQADLLADTFEYELFALARSSNGVCYVSGAPNGTIIRINQDGEQQNLVDLPEGLIWDLLLIPDGRLFASTGQMGDIYRIDPDGTTTKIGSIPDAHAVSLSWWNGRIICGSDGTGLLTSIDPDNGELEILFDSDQDEIVDILPLDSDRILFAVNGQNNPASGSGNGTMILPPINVSPDGMAFGPTVYELEANGFIRPVFNCVEDDIFCLCEAPDGSILVGTGGKGVLYQLDSHWNSNRLLDLDQNQILSLEADGDVVFVGTGNGGSVYRLDWSKKREGQYTSRVLDASTTVQWGAPGWVAAGAGEITMETRSGLIETPDDTWTDWKALSEDHIASKAGRFLQWRINLKAKNSKELFKISNVRIPYRGPNRPPRLISVTVSAKNSEGNMEAVKNGSGNFRQELPGGVRVEYTVDENSNGLNHRTSVRPGGWARNMRTASWKAHDPDGDILLYDLYMRLIEDNEYFLLKKDIETRAFSYDASAWPEGWYEMKVVARDEESNQSGEGCEASRLSVPFLVDNTAPFLEDLTLDWSGEGDGRELILSGKGIDQLSIIAGLEISLNGDGWRSQLPADGIFDSKEELIRLNIPQTDSEEYPTYVGVRIVDQIGHFGTARVRVP